MQASWNALVKREVDTRSATVGVMLLAAVFAGALAFARGQGLGSVSGHMFAVGAGIAEGLYLYSLAKALHLGSLGRVYAIARGGSLVLLWPASLFLLHEHASMLGLAGAAVLILGIVVTGLARPPPGALQPHAATSWAVLAALGIAGYTFLYKRALLAGAAPGALFCASITLALAINLLLTRERLKALRGFLRKRWAFALLGGFLACTSFWLYLFCLGRGGTGALATLRNTSILFAQGYALALGEKPSRAQWIASGFILAGAALLSLR